METKFIIVIRNNGEYKILEYFYTKEIDDLEKVKIDMVEDIIEC